MEYYLIMLDGEKGDNKYIFAEPCADVEDQYMFQNGKIIKEWEPMQFECDLRKGSVVIEYLGNSFGWDIFSEKALELLGDLINNDVQLLPVKVINKATGQEIGKYFVVNVLPFLDALDLENSVYNYYDIDIDGRKEKWLSVIKYGIKKAKVAEHHIFRLKESSSDVFVSEKFKKIVEKTKCWELTFRE